MKLSILLLLVTLFSHLPAQADPREACDCSRCAPTWQCCFTVGSQCGCFKRDLPCPRPVPLTDALFSAASFALPVSAQATYNALNTTESQMVYRDSEGKPLPGIMAFEKNNQSGTLCRKVMSTQHPSFRYSCYRLGISGPSAKRFYDALPSPLGVLSVEYVHLAGATYHEKANNQWICQKVEPVVPRPVPRYTCYRRLQLP